MPFQQGQPVLPAIGTPPSGRAPAAVPGPAGPPVELPAEPAGVPRTGSRPAPAAEPRAGSQGRVPAGPRLVFVDSLRVFLSITVIVHHVACTYAFPGVWYYFEQSRSPAGTYALAALIMFNQAFNMGFYFLLSGYFVPGSRDRKGTRSFLADRFLKLFVPLIAFDLVLGPITAIAGSIPSGVHRPLWKTYLADLGPGPLWFVEVLLVLSCVYVLGRWLLRRPVPAVPAAPEPLRFRAILGFALLLGVVSAVFRIWVPVGASVPVVDLPSPGYLPQYLGLFAVGVLAYRRDWFRTVPNWMGRAGFGLALGSTVLLLPLAMSGGPTAFLGNGHWQSAAYALWDSLFCVGTCLALTVMFRRRLNRLGRLGSFMRRHVYTVYVIHAPLLVFLALALRGVHVFVLLKFLLVAVLAVPLCFSVAYLVRKLPFTRKVLQ